MKNLLTTYLSLFMGAAVLLCGAHASDVAGLSLQPASILAKKVFGGNDGTLVKTSPDLHNHVDKQALHSFTQDPMQADNRSLHHRKHSKGLVYKHHSHWLSELWLQYLSATV